MQAIEQYSGVWKSEKYGKAIGQGNVYVDLPVDFDSKSTVDTKAIIVYLGIYRFKKKQLLPIKINSKDEATSELQTDPKDLKSVMHKATEEEKKELLKNKDKKNIQGVLSFKILKNEEGVISGTYTLSQPHDFGTFTLKKGKDHGTKCIIQ
jgi:hypothetical protein